MQATVHTILKCFETSYKMLEEKVITSLKMKGLENQNLQTLEIANNKVSDISGEDNTENTNESNE